ncbi:GNAT family N-acetyltransferase [Lysobacter sp. MMG2]|uniref:GNAT family N-acetyltransferase n=1 Tax=Lysobacter sp. MMG2 TaxID=2801338 RepID=UPI001C2247AD|nr:GNAT family N-acetyltransferase [Lysobacter sp. MMG2]MBU8976120.1 GNAT family N-acetyltransferase [Lysobacter sp. MMG2]
MPTFRPATAADLAALLPVIRQFHADEHIAWDESRVRPALEALIGEPYNGRLVLIERDGALAGYFAVGFCFSLEFGGRYGLLDELYVLPAQRGGGVGKRALAEVEAVCRAEGLRCVRLEVSDDNPLAREIYRRSGYAENPRRLMTKWLSGASEG